MTALRVPRPATESDLGDQRPEMARALTSAVQALGAGLTQHVR